MTSILLMLLLSIIGAQRLTRPLSCPATCVVCSEDAVICHRLAHILDAPDSTQALLLTEGSISTVHPSSLSDLSNVTLIGLSHNRISILDEQPFRHLAFLHTLLLDHNLLTSQALQGGALRHLTHLEVLALGNNHINMIEAGWFEGTKALRSLKLEGNLLTSLDSGSFPLNDLRDLDTLDLSDNLIDHLNRDSFHGLSSLGTLDLSRNRLSSAPAEAFSYLSWLTSLNLDLNSWNCSCQLLELSAFLSNFIQQPDKVVYNGRRMVCVSADNPAVTTVLELTQANCVPSNHNITLQVKPANSVTPQLYARDMAITAVVCFTGGVGLTLLVVLIYYQVSHRKKLRERNRQKEKGGSTVVNHNGNHQDQSGKRRNLPLPAHISQSWDREAALLDPRIETHGDHVRSRVGEGSGQFKCPGCSAEGQRGAGLNPMRRDNRMNGGTEAEEERERRRVRMIMEEERRRPGTRQPIPQQGILTRDAAVTGHKSLSHGNYYSAAQREAVSGARPESLSTNKTIREMDNSRTDMDGKSGAGNEILRCEICHKTYEHRPTGQADRQGRFHTSRRDSAPFDGYHSQRSDRDVSYNQLDFERNGGSRREMRNVTFHVERPEMLHKEDRGGESRAKQRGREEGSGKHKANVQSSRVLKVKLNLNPLRKTKVHPKRKKEQGHAEKSSSKKEHRLKGSQEKVGIGRGEKEARGSLSQKKKQSGEKVKRSTGTKGLPEDDEKEKEDEEGGEGGQKSSKQQKPTSNTQQGCQESSEGDQQNNKHPENFQDTPADAADTTAQSDATRAAEASAIGQQVGPVTDLQGQITQGSGVQSHGTSLHLQSGQLSSQPPLILSDRNGTTNPSMLGMAGTQQAGSSLSLQGVNSLSHMAPTANNIFPNQSAIAVAPNLAYGGLSTLKPNAASSSDPESQSFSRQAGLGLSSDATSLLANIIHANPLLGGATHTSPMHASLSGGLTSNLAASPAINPTPVQTLSQSQPPPDTTSLAARIRNYPAQGHGPQCGEGLHQLAPQRGEGLHQLAPQRGEGLHQLAPQRGEGLHQLAPQRGEGLHQLAPQSGEGLHQLAPQRGEGLHQLAPQRGEGLHQLAPQRGEGLHQLAPQRGEGLHQLAPQRGEGLHQLAPQRGEGLHQLAPQRGEGLHQLAPPPPALPTKDIFPLPTQAQGPVGGDGLSALAPQAPEPVTLTLENLSNNITLSQTGAGGASVSGGTVVKVSTGSLSAGGVATADGSAAGVSGGNMHVADVSLSGVSAATLSTQNVSAGVGSSPVSVSAAATLLQQEYLSEEGSSPKRRLRLVLPEKTSDRPRTALEKKIR